MSKISLSSPLKIFIIYILVSALGIMGFRLVFPGEAVPLAHFSISWRLIRGFVDFLGLFPTLALSALIIPFGFKTQPGEKMSPFSPQFLQTIKASIVTAIMAAGVYGILFSLVFPLARDYESELRFQGSLYRLAKENAQYYASSGDWAEAAQYLAVCERIWPGGPEVASLKTEADIRNEERWMSYEPLADSRAVDTRSGLPGPQPLDVTDALALGESALAEGRFFDAHWLATLAGRLARPNSVELAQATRLAGRAWTGVNSLAPNIRETEAFAVYRLKREGYEALHAREWIRAYYIFLELLALSPDDPDAHAFFALSEEGVMQIAFFIDELEFALGRTLTSAVFSLPLNSGRMVMRLASLSTFSDSAYGTGAEILAFDRDGRPLWSIEAPYIKILPLTLDSMRTQEPGVTILLRALDRADRTLFWEPVVQGMGQNSPEGAQTVLDISWDTFLLLSNIHRGPSALSLADLRRAAESLGDCGYQSQIFEAELIRRFAEPLFLLPLGIFVIIVGWRYRALKRPRYMTVPMLGILPLVFNGFVHLCRGWVNNMGIWTVVTMGFSTAVLIIAAGITLLFALLLILLAAQRS